MFLYPCLTQWFWTLFRYLIDNWNRKLTLGDPGRFVFLLIHKWKLMLESICSSLSGYIVCSVTKPSQKLACSQFCYMQTYDLSAICYNNTLPCTIYALVTLGWCKSNASKQTSSHKHPRGVSCSICFSISHYCIMWLISHADEVKNDILFYVLIKELWSSSVSLSSGWLRGFKRAQWKSRPITCWQ